MTSSTRTSTTLFAAFTLILIPHALHSAGLPERLKPVDAGSSLSMITESTPAPIIGPERPQDAVTAPHPQDDVFREPGPRIPASLDPRADAAPERLTPEEQSVADESETLLSEKERFEQVYREIEQSFRARGASAEILESLMKALKQPIREATRGPASESNVVDVRKIDEVMRRYIENQDEDLTEDAD